MQKYNVSFLLFVGTTVLHLILGALCMTYRSSCETIPWSWLVSLSIPLYIAIQTKTSRLSKIVVFCILALYILVLAMFISNRFYVKYRHPQKLAEIERQFSARTKTFEIEAAKRQVDIWMQDIKDEGEKETMRETFWKKH